MKRLTAVLLSLLLALSLLLTACAPPAEYLPEGADDETELTLVIIEDNEPTDETPDDVHANAPPEETEKAPEEDKTDAPAAIDEDGWYYSKNDVALYIHTYGRLPGNYITKKQAEKLGWSNGSLERYAPGKAIGGDRFGNYEGLLPAKKGRTYTECDIDTRGAKKRGAKRIVFSNDGLIYYTDDHYESFTLLYGEE